MAEIEKYQTTIKAQPKRCKALNLLAQSYDEELRTVKEENKVLSLELYVLSPRLDATNLMNTTLVNLNDELRTEVAVLRAKYENYALSLTNSNDSTIFINLC